MSVRIYEMRQKEVINIKDGKRLGYISDICVDVDEGNIDSIVIPGPGKVFGIFGREQEYKIPWSGIKQVGDDLILVDVETSKVLVDCADE